MGSCVTTPAGRVGVAGAVRAYPSYALASTKESVGSSHLILLPLPPVSSQPCWIGRAPIALPAISTAALSPRW
eukprot:9492451-Pyramimonas_sp.AAC.1